MISVRFQKCVPTKQVLHLHPRAVAQSNGVEMSSRPCNISNASTESVNPFRTVVSFWGKLGAKDFEFEWCVPKTGVLKGLTAPYS